MVATTIHSLPSELLEFIFEQIDTISQAAECRLVCKAWCDPAERAMFGLPIAIGSPYIIQKLMRVFSQYPAKANLIKHLNFTLLDDYAPEILDIFLMFALTPTITSLTGHLDKDHFDALSRNIRSLPPGTFPHLTIFTIDYNFTSQAYQELVPYLCKSLHEWSINCFTNDGWNLLEDLTRFTHLKCICIKGSITHIGALNNILNTCQQLEHLTFWGYILELSVDNLIHDAAMVERKHNLKTFKVADGPPSSYPPLLDYIVNKCPHLLKVSIEYFVYDYHDLEISLPFLGRLIQNVPQKDFRVKILRSVQDLRRAQEYVRRHYNRVLIDKVTNDGEIVFKIE